MINKRLMSIMGLFFILTFPAAASMVSFLVVETGLNENVPANQLSTLWGGGLMAAFFDDGHIVTDSPIVRMEKRPSQDFTGQVEADFKEAVTAGSEFFLLGFLEYQIVAGKVVPVNITLKLYTASSRKLIFEQIFPVGAGKNFAEEHQFAQNAGKIIVSHLRDR